MIPSPKGVTSRASQALAAVAAVDSAPGREICEELIAGTEECRRRGRGTWGISQPMIWQFCSSFHGKNMYIRRFNHQFGEV